MVDILSINETGLYRRRSATTCMDDVVADVLNSKVKFGGVGSRNRAR